MNLKTMKCPICGSTKKEWDNVMQEYTCKDCFFVLPI